MHLKLLFILSIMQLFPSNTKAQNESKPLKIGVVGLTHTHVHWILGREDRGDIEIVGIVEPNRALAERYAEQHGYSTDLVYPTLEETYELEELNAPMNDPFALLAAVVRGELTLPPFDLNSLENNMFNLFFSFY